MLFVFANKYVKMSASMQDKKSILFSVLSIVLIALSTVETASAINLVDLPLKISSQSVNLHATLSDANALIKYFIQESISASGPSIKGKIVISGEKDSYNVHYNTGAIFNKERLVIHGTNCLTFTFKNNWDKTLPGISKPVTNLILLMGPSILYRLDHSSLVWREAQDKNIRGTMMKGATTEVNKRLKITYYYKSKFNDESGIKNPSRIEFSGYDPSSTAIGSKENLILDIYLQSENDYDQFANEVQPLPGIGCTHYLSTPKNSFPKLINNYVHYTMYETIQGTTTTRTYSEIHASGTRNVLRLKANLLGTTTEAIYDYQLGLFFILQDDGSCGNQPIDLKAPGINSNGYFTIPSLFLVDQDQSSFVYLGKLNFEHRSGFPVDAWETTRFNTYINGKKVDKAVITHYFAESRDSKIFDGYILVSTTIAIYKLDSSKKTYTLIDGITRDFIDFEVAGFEDELHDIFSIKECTYSIGDERLTLGFQFQCQDDSSQCTELTGNRVYQFKQDFVDFFIATRKISPLRIDSVQYIFNDDQIEMDVTLLEAPKMNVIFNSKTLFVVEDTFKKMKTIKANSEFECLDKLSRSFDLIIVVIYRPSDSLCGYLTNFDDFKEDTKIGRPSSVYHFPLNNLRRISQELTLDNIHKDFLRDVGKSYSLYDGDKLALYKFIDLIDKTKNQDASKYLVYLVKVEEKLIINDQITMKLPGVKTFAECYKSCRDSEQLSCMTLSFCEHGDSVECRVSSLPSMELGTKYVEQDKECSIYALNARIDYTEVHNRKFKTQTSAAVWESLDNCAESCYASLDCFSFQYCDYSCSFGGLYTDSATEYDGECSIFYPKVSQKYQKTGNKIVSEVIHTEMNLNLDQCASLCHGWSDGETGCKSFNYCPKSKTKSSCSLTKFSVKSSDTKTIEGGECSNYELKDESKGQNNKESSSMEVTKGTSGSGAFGIIMLFLFVGALLGFAAPIGYTKFKQLRNATEINQSFSWTRQLDADEQTENVP